MFGRKSRSIANGFVAGLVLASGILIAPIAAQVALSSPAGASSNIANLIPDAGQYFPVTPKMILDTRSGLGEPGGIAAGGFRIGAGGSVVDVPVDGMGSIPSSGVSAVFINIQVLYASANGYITDYSADVSNPGHASLNFHASHPESGSDIVAVAADGSPNAGQISFTNNGSATIDLAATVEGYFTDGTNSTAGDAFVGVPATTLCDTRNIYEGCGAPVGAQLPAWGQMSFNVSSNPLASSVLNQAHISASDIDAVEFQVGALSPGGVGYLNFSGAAGSPPLRSQTYEPGEVNRQTDILQPDGSGNITITNGSGYPVTIQVNLRGIFTNPTATLSLGTEYTPLATPETVCDTRSGCTYYNPITSQTTTTYAVAANHSVTIEEAGVGGSNGIPASQVGYVANEINAINNTSSGWLTVAPAGATSSIAAVNFWTGEGSVTSTAFDDTVISQTSLAGAITITNVSSGSVDVIVSARGYWTNPTNPDPVSSPNSEYSGGQSLITWAEPATDGGAPITSYSIFDASSPSAPIDTVDGGTFQDTVTIPDGDNVYIVATNVVGPSSNNPEISDDPLLNNANSTVANANSQFPLPTGDTLPIVWSGSIVDSNQTPVSAELTATAVPIDIQATSTDPTGVGTPDVLLSSGETDANGNFSIQAGPTSALDSLMSATDGSFYVFLEVSTSTGEYSFVRRMNLVAPGQVVGPLLADNNVLTSTGLSADGSALVGASWSSIDDNAQQNGQQLVVDAAIAPGATDVETNTPDVGPLPTSTALNPPLALNSLATAGGATSGSLQLTAPDGSTFSVVTQVNSASTTHGPVCFVDGVTAKAPPNAKVTRAWLKNFGKPWEKQPTYYQTTKVAGQRPLPLEIPMIIAQMGFDSAASRYASENGGVAWTASIAAGSSTDIGTYSNTVSGLNGLGISNSWSTSKVTSTKEALNTTTSAQTVPEWSYESYIWLELHPTLYRSMCWTWTNASELIEEVTGQTGEVPNGDSSKTLAEILQNYYGFSWKRHFYLDFPRWFDWQAQYTGPPGGYGVGATPTTSGSAADKRSQEANYGVKFYDGGGNPCQTPSGTGGYSVLDGQGFSQTSSHFETNTSGTSFGFNGEASAAVGKLAALGSFLNFGIKDLSQHSTSNTTGSTTYLSATNHMSGSPDGFGFVCFYGSSSDRTGGDVGGAWPQASSQYDPLGKADPIFTW